MLRWKSPEAGVGVAPAILKALGHTASGSLV